jgi:hypothetical protein
MKHNLPRHGQGFAILLAGLTFAVAVVSGLFLIYQESGTAPAPLEFAPSSSIAEVQKQKAPDADHSRARHLHVPHIPHTHHRVRA